MGTINLEKVVGSAIHGPSVNGVALYSRADNTYGETRNAAWLKAVETKYSSPNNIRKIWICNDKIVVQLYQPTAGDSNKLNWREKFILVGLEAGTVMRGNALASIIKPWVCSNIEEVYFDSLVLMGDVSTEYKIGRLMPDVVAGGKSIGPKVAAEVFMGACYNGNTSADVRARFPRLNIVGFISGLSEMIGLSKTYCKTGINYIDEEIKIWAEIPAVAKEIVENRYSSIWRLADSAGKDMYNSNFFSRPGIYRYDDEILISYFERYKDKLNKLKAASAGNKGTPLVKAVEEAIDTCGEPWVKTVLSIADFIDKSGDRDTVMAELSKSSKISSCINK